MRRALFLLPVLAAGCGFLFAAAGGGRCDPADFEARCDGAILTACLDGVVATVTCDSEAECDATAPSCHGCNGLPEPGDFCPVGPSTVNAGFSPEGIAAGDLNGDGAVDFVISNERPGVITLIADPSGNGLAIIGEVDIGLPGPEGSFIGDPNGNNINDAADLPRRVVAADFDGLAGDDVAVPARGAGRVEVYPVREDFTFAAPALLDVAEPFALAAGDFNGDGRADLAAVGLNGGGPGVLAIFLNQGGNAFNKVGVFSTGVGPQAVAAGDLDGDGDDDIVVAAGGSNGLDIFLSGPGAQFEPGPALDVTPAGLAPGSLALADFDGDARLDIAAGNSFGLDGGALGDASIALFFNAGGSRPAGAALAFEAPLAIPTAGSFPFIAAADLDEDGAPDIAAAVAGGASAQIFLNRLPTGGGFDARAVPLGVAPADIALGFIDAGAALGIAVPDRSGVAAFLSLGR